jgi:hypothetical protein
MFQIFLSVISGINMIRGFLIFLIFIWKPSVWKKIVKRHPRFARLLTLPVKYFTRELKNEETVQLPMEQINLFEQNVLEIIQHELKQNDPVGSFLN